MNVQGYMPADLAVAATRAAVSKHASTHRSTAATLDGSGGDGQNAQSGLAQGLLGSLLSNPALVLQALESLPSTGNAAADLAIQSAKG